MKTIITSIFFSLLTLASIVTSEYSLMIFKNAQEQALNTKFSFYYGWVEQGGEKQFFIQKNHIISTKTQKADLSTTLSTPKMESVLEKSLNNICQQCKLISYKQANFYESLQAMKIAKQKLIANKRNVIKITFGNG